MNMNRSTLAALAAACALAFAGSAIAHENHDAKKPAAAVKKEQKLYLWDWSMIPERGPRFENMVASQLLKFCHLHEDVEGHRMELRFLRDVDRREVDFVVIKDKKPLFAVECKTGDKSASAAARYFADRTPIPVFYQVHLGERHFQSGKVVVIPFARFCRELAMP